MSREDLELEPDGENQKFLKGRIELDGLPTDLTVLPGPLSARLVSPSGETLTANEYQSPRWLALMMGYYAPLVRFSIPGSEEPELLRQVLGEVRFLSARGIPFAQPSLDLLSVSKDLYERYRGVKIVYSARVDLFLVRADQTTTLRLERRAVHDRGSDRIEILWIGRPRAGFLTVDVSETAHRVAGDGWATATYVLRNPWRREVLLGRVDGLSFSNAPTWLGLVGFSPTLIYPSLEFERLQLNFELPEGSPPLPDKWLRGAELVRVETTHLGVFSKTIRIEDLVMERIPVSPESSGSTPRQETPVGAGEWGIGW